MLIKREDIVIVLKLMYKRKTMHKREIVEFKGRWKTLLQTGISSFVKIKALSENHHSRPYLLTQTCGLLSNSRSKSEKKTKRLWI